MAHPIMSRRKTQALSVSLFLIGLAIITFFDIPWWPSIIIVIGIPLALRQFLLGRPYDMIVTLIVSIGVFITSQFEIAWKMIMPILFIVGAIYIFFREFIPAEPVSEEEEEENIEKEIEEEHKD